MRSVRKLLLFLWLLMANNTILNAGVGGDTVALEDIAGVKYELIKLIDSTAGSTTPIGVAANPLRFDPTGTTTQPISGTITAITNAVAVTGTFFQSTQPVSLTSVPTHAVTQSGAWSITGTVTVDGSGVTQPVSIAGTVVVNGSGVTQPVSGPLTDAQLRAATVPISGTVTANAGSGTQAVSLATLPALVAGSANIGDVDVLSVAAGTNRIGAVYDACGQLVDEVPTLRTVNRAFANATALGNTEVVAAQSAGIRIRVLSLLAVATVGVTVKFQSATSDITAGFPLGANGGMVLPYNPHGWFQTAAAEALNINLSFATATGCQLTWCQAT